LEKRYLVEIEGNFDKRHLDQLLEGVNLEDGFARALKAELVRSVSKNHHWVDIVIHEGRYHIIRRLLESLELKVLRLIRTEFGPVKLSEMKSGRHRPLNNQELVKLFTTLNIKQ
jgi:23S rRNA pseudouridine2605 synthase